MPTGLQEPKARSQFWLGNIRSRDALKPIARERKDLMDYSVWYRSHKWYLSNGIQCVVLEFKCGFPHLSERVVLTLRYFLYFFSCFINVAFVYCKQFCRKSLISRKDTSQYFLKYLSHFLLIWKRAMVFQRKNNGIPNGRKKEITHLSF